MYDLGNSTNNDNFWRMLKVFLALKYDNENVLSQNVDPRKGEKMERFFQNVLKERAIVTGKTEYMTI